MGSDVDNDDDDDRGKDDGDMIILGVGRAA